MVEAELLELPDGADAVPRARRFAMDAARRLGHDEHVHDVALVVSELTTNALLHGRPPVVIRVLQSGSGVRVEVDDASGALPLRARPDAGSMTGRGMSLVDALSTDWGVTPLPHGKTVWAVLDEGLGTSPVLGVVGPAGVARPQVAPSSRPAARDVTPAAVGVAPDGSDIYTVTLGDVPTDLLLAAKAHVDNLVREFTLAASGAQTGATAAVPAPLASLIDTVVHGFAGARASIKRQALEAANNGEPRTHLTLTLPVSAAGAGDAYLAALDEADAYARAARLLTLETPPQHHAFRQWYVQSLVRQLRALAAGLPLPVPESFEQRLLIELNAVTEGRQVAERGARLQAVTSALSGATTVDEVTSVVVREGLEALGASAGSVMLRGDEDRVAVSSAIGYAEQALDVMRDERVTTDLPGATVLRTGAAVWLESRQEIESMFPSLGRMEPLTQSLCAVPAAVVGRVVGALRFSFSTPRLFDTDERRFVLALAAQAGQALDRSQLYGAEHRARSAAEALAVRLRRLQQVTAALSAAEEVENVAEIVVTQVREALGAVNASLCLLEGDAMRILAISGVRDDLVEQYREFSVHADLPASEAVRNGTTIVVAGRDELVRRYPLLKDNDARDGRVVCLPLHTGDRRIGAISLQFPVGESDDDPDWVTFLLGLADAAAQALDRVLAQGIARSAAAKLSFLADASSELAESLDYRRTLAKVAALTVPRLADWCSVTIIGADGGLDTIAVAHVDPERVAFAEQLERLYPTDPQATTGVPQVIRTGSPELTAVITPEMVEAAAVDDRHRALLREIGLTSALVVPLTGRAGTFGALTLVYAESGRRFEETDVQFAVELARRAAMAVENAQTYELQSGRLAEITRIAEVAQHAILAPVPPRLGPLAMAGEYVSATREALVGGDLYEIVRAPGVTRLLIGDVRGKGLDAVRLATVVLGYFRSLAADDLDPALLARLLDVRLAPHLGDEDFVTALVVEVTDDGRASVLSCGHPPPILASRSGLSELSGPPALPLGLGSEPVAVQRDLAAGDRLLLYTDGLIEARDAEGRFTDLDRVLAPLATSTLPDSLSSIVAELRAAAGGELDDDLALLAVEFWPL